MRSYAWLFVSVAALSVCAFWFGFPGVGQPQAGTPAAAVPMRETLDLTSMLHSAVSIPERIDRLEASVVACTVALGLVGLVNAGLLIWMLRSRSLATAAPARLPSATVPFLRIPATGPPVSSPVKAAPPMPSRTVAEPAADPAPAAPTLIDLPPAAPAPVAAAVPAAVCACGAAISPRTKTGRCRACALDQRAGRGGRSARCTEAPELAAAGP